MNHIQVYLGILLFMVVSCNHKGNRPSGVDDVLQCAGQNRQELEKVLEFYQNDSLKYRAACFLIENMSGHFSYQGEAMEYCKRKLKTLPRQLRSDSMKVFWQQAASMYPDGAFDRIPDCVTIKSAYLIANINQAFRIWEEAPWHKEVSFETFCCYILPYRISDEQLADDVHWRDTLAKRYADCISGVTDMKRAFALLSKEFDDLRKRPLLKCPYMLDALTMEEVGFSLCEQRCIVRGNVMRALGLPVVGDYVDGWANYSRHGHFWISLVENTGETYTLYPRDSIPKTDNPIDAAFFKPSMLPDSSYPYWVDSLKRVAKVYRKAFYSVNEKDQHAEDVSKKYGLTDSVVIYTDGVEKAICLCTFKSGDGWRVAIKGEVNNGRCVFRNLGASIIYLPAKLEKGKIIALDAPFALNRGGKVRRMIPASGKQTVRLNRKYIFLTTWTNRWNEMTGGCFEGSNDSHFRRADVLWRISELPVYRNEVKLQTSKSYRYVRYISPGISKSALAELFFFDKEKELKGEAIGEGLTPSSQKRVFDRDWKTIGDPRTENYWVGLDLRERCHLDKIVYYPHNDDNFITPGDLYELFYYNEGNWHSLGTKVAESEELIYEQVPVNVLFVLKNTTRGQEERIFTYENGKQVWW